MRLRQAGGRGVLLATAALVTVAVAACGGNQAASGSSTSPISAPTQAGAPAQGQSATAPQSGGACRAGDLSAALGSKKEVPVNVQGQLGAAGTHYSVDLVWTNHSSHTCTMHGFAGVDLKGPDLGSSGSPTFSLPRTSESPDTVTLAPDASAHTKIVYIDPSGSQPDSGSLWKPTNLEVTPPNDTTHMSVPWTAGTPVYHDSTDGDQSASTSPVAAGS